MILKDDILKQEVNFSFIKRMFNMKLAICDDNKEAINYLKPIIYEYAESHKIDLCIDEFYSGEELLKSPDNYNIIIMDYQMGELNGMDTVRVLRKNNINSVIIFLTGFPQFVYEAFEVNTFRFFEKPVSADKLHKAFDDYLKMYGHDYPLLLKCDKETIIIETKDIVYLEPDNKRCMIHLTDKSICCSKTMTVISELLPKNHFYKVCRFYIVNFNHIEKYDNEYIYFKNGEKAHISRKYLTTFKEAYKNYSDLNRMY